MTSGTDSGPESEKSGKRPADSGETDRAGAVRSGEGKQGIHED